MTLSALDSLYQAVYAHLLGRGNWGNRVYPDQAPANATRPYIVYFWAGGGESNWTRHEDANIILSVKCVGNTMGDSLTGASYLHAALNDKGEQDSTSAVSATDWTITTITSDRAIHIVEAYANVSPIYHDGMQFRFIMQKD